MRTIGNVLWFILAGVWLAIGYAAAGVILCITIIGIPFGNQAFKLAGFTLWPFGRSVVRTPQGGGCLETVFNVVWQGDADDRDAQQQAGHDVGGRRRRRTRRPGGARRALGADDQVLNGRSKFDASIV